MKKRGKPASAKRGSKRVRAKDLSPTRGGSARGGSKYTLFLPDGTPVKAAAAPTTQLKEPTSLEFPN
jgi:hypothetical protein